MFEILFWCVAQLNVDAPKHLLNASYTGANYYICGKLNQDMEALYGIATKYLNPHGIAVPAKYCQNSTCV